MKSGPAKSPAEARGRALDRARMAPPSGIRFLGADRAAILCFGRLEIWNLDSGELCQRVPAGGRVSAWAPVGDASFLIGTEASGLRLLDGSGDSRRSFELETSATRFLGAEFSGLWTLERHRGDDEADAPLRPFPPYSTPCDVAVDRSGEFAVVAYGQSFVLVWNLGTGALLSCVGRDRPGDQVRVYRVDLSGDGSTLLTRDSDGRVRVWDWRAGREIRTFRVTGYPPVQVIPSQMVMTRAGVPPARFVADSDRIAVAVGACIRVAHVDSGAFFDTWTGHGTEHPFIDHSWLPTIIDMRVSADGSRVLTAGVDATLRVWDVATGRQIWQAQPDPCCIDWADLSADGRRVLWTNCPGARLYEIP